MSVVMMLMAVGICLGANPQDPRRGDGRRPSVDCSGPVGFTAVGFNTVHQSGLLSYRNTLLDKAVGFNKETGEVTIYCPGVYQITFAAYGDSPQTRVMLKTRRGNSQSWSGTVSAGGDHSGGGSNQVYVALEEGDQAGVWLTSGRLTPEPNPPLTTFSAFKLTK